MGVRGAPRPRRGGAWGCAGRCARPSGSSAPCGDRQKVGHVCLGRGRNSSGGFKTQRPGLGCARPSPPHTHPPPRPGTPTPWGAPVRPPGPPPAGDARAASGWGRGMLHPRAHFDTPPMGACDARGGVRTRGLRGPPGTCPGVGVHRPSLPLRGNRGTAGHPTNPPVLSPPRGARGGPGLLTTAPGQALGPAASSTYRAGAARPGAAANVCSIWERRARRLPSIGTGSAPGLCGPAGHRPPRRPPPPLPPGPRVPAEPRPRSVHV